MTVFLFSKPHNLFNLFFILNSFMHLKRGIIIDCNQSWKASYNNIIGKLTLKKVIIVEMGRILSAPPPSFQFLYHYLHVPITFPIDIKIELGFSGMILFLFLLNNIDKLAENNAIDIPILVTFLRIELNAMIQTSHISFKIV